MEHVDRFLDRLPQQRRRVPWQAVVRQRLHGLDAALAAEQTGTGEAWLDARARHLTHERELLQRRIGTLRAQLTESAVEQVVQDELQRLIHDVRRHHQRVSDLLYDAVARDVGGSE